MTTERDISDILEFMHDMDLSTKEYVLVVRGLVQELEAELDALGAE